MKILYILRHNPWGIGGGCYASHCYLNVFTKVFENAKFDVCLCSEYLGSKRQLEAYPNVNFVKVSERSKVEKAMSSITGLLHRFDGVARNMLKTGVYDYCVFDHNSIAGPLVGLCRKMGVKSIVINHNCEYEYYRDNHSLIERAVFLRHVRNAERKSYLGCDYNIFLTEEDKELFEWLYGISGTRSIVTGCFDESGNQNSNPNEHEPIATNDSHNPHVRIIISGTIGNIQNMDGINFFIKELLPSVPQDAEVIIAGKNPPTSLSIEIETLNQTGNYAPITLIPNPEDMMSIVSGCDIFLCPTRLGGGLKLRVMDGLRAGLPVIAHQVSARGYSEFKKAGMLWSFESPEEFRQALIAVLSHLQAGNVKKEDIKMKAKREFSFDEKVNVLRTIILR